MHIAIFTDTFVPNLDGVVTTTIASAKELARRGHTVTLVVPEFSQKYQEFEYENIYVERVPSIPAFAHKEYRITNPWNKHILRILRERGVDVVHVQTPWTVGMLGVRCAKKLHVPIVGTFHTFHADPEYLQNLGLRWAAPVVGKLVWRLEVAFYNACNKVTCPSRDAQDELRKHGCISEMMFLPNGIDTSLFSGEHASHTREKFAPQGEKLLLYVGRVAPEKSIDVLLRTFALVRTRGVPARFLIVGDGASRKSLEQLARELGVQNDVVFTGYMAHDELVALSMFAAADIFVTAAKTENGPITVIESQISGTPCVGVHARNIPYMIGDGEDGRVVPPDNPEAFADAVCEILGDAELYENMSDASRAKGETYSIRAIAQQWESIYAGLKTYN